MIDLLIVRISGSDTLPQCVESSRLLLQEHGKRLHRVAPLLQRPLVLGNLTTVDQSQLGQEIFVLTKCARIGGIDAYHRNVGRGLGIPREDFVDLPQQRLIDAVLDHDHGDGPVVGQPRQQPPGLLAKRVGPGLGRINTKPQPRPGCEEIHNDPNRHDTPKEQGQVELSLRPPRDRPALSLGLVIHRHLRASSDPTDATNSTSVTEQK